MISSTAWLASLWLLAAPSPTPAVAVEQRAAASAASRAGDFALAQKAADLAVAAAPDWPDGYFTRAAVRLAAAGAASEVEALKHPQPRVNYGQVKKLLEGAAADLRKFLQLNPGAANRDVVLEVVGELSVRISLAGQAASMPVELPCFDGQERIKGRCRGVAQCPPGRVFDAAKETCACSPGMVPVGPPDSEICCWPNQTFSETSGGCLGTPKCGAGHRPWPGQGLCLPPIELVPFLEGDGICEEGRKGWMMVLTKDVEQKLDLHRPVGDFSVYWEQYFLRYPPTADVDFGQLMLVDSGRCREATSANGGYACCGKR